MDFGFTKEQEILRQSVKEFVDREIRPTAHEVDDNPDLIMGLWKKIAAQGYTGTPFPVEYGGLGMNASSYVMVEEIISHACPSLALMVATHNGATMYLYLHGTEEQKKKYMVPYAKGEWISAGGGTEPNAGHDFSMMESTAVLDGDEWVLNGRKCFISNGDRADCHCMLFMTDKSKGTRGLSCFIIEGDRPGISVPKVENKIGTHGMTSCDVVYKDVRIPKENLLGEVGRGYLVTLGAADRGRLAYSASEIGAAQFCLDQAVSHAAERVQFGQVIGKFQAVQLMLADMAIKTETARLLNYKAASIYDANPTEKDGTYAKETAMAFTYAGETSRDVAHMAMKIFGGYGTVKEYRIEQYFRDIQVFSIIPSSDVLKAYTIGARMVREASK
ncbi:MAG: acyl-CoA dehydrogenase family protein [Chloroflexota bacterium]|nr:acyl-CoA dehydrogenase family protein [Chloroflexota bacterium]